MNSPVDVRENSVRKESTSENPTLAEGKSSLEEDFLVDQPRESKKSGKIEHLKEKSILWDDGEFGSARGSEDTN